MTRAVYLVDTDVISHARKRTRANPGVRQFFRDAATQGIPLFLRRRPTAAETDGIVDMILAATKRVPSSEVVG